MKNSSRINHIIIDGFVGSGTTIVVSEQLNRICYAMEDEPRFCDVTVTRWEKLTGKKAKRIPYNGIKETNKKGPAKKESASKKSSQETAQAC